VELIIIFIAISLHDAIHNLDLFYFGSKLRYSTEVRSRELLFSEKSELVLLDEMLEAVRLPAFENEVFVQVFSLIVELHQTGDKTIYNKLKHLIFGHLSHFNVGEKFDIINFTNNYCVIKYNQGEHKYLNEIFELYEYGLKQEIWTADGIIEHTMFYNIVVIACNLERYNWVKTFILQYAECLRKEVREDMKILALCRLEFSMGNFEKTLELLRDIEIVDVMRNISAKVFQLRCYYELENYEDVFYDACNAFTQFCRRRRELGASTKERHLNFIKFLRRLYQARLYNKEGKTALFKDLENQPIVFKPWLREKIQEDVKEK